MLRQKEIDKAIFRKKVELWLKGVFCCCQKGVKKEERELLEHPEQFQYVDKDKSRKKLKGFLKKINHGEQQLKGDLKLMEGVSLWVFPVESKIRRLLYQVVHQTWFEYFVLLVITASTVQIALDSPLHDPKGQMYLAIDVIDKVTTAIFLLEMAMKMVAFGLLLNGENSFLLGPANILDFVVTMLSVSAHHYMLNRYCRRSLIMLIWECSRC
jgi:Ion transport protein